MGLYDFTFYDLIDRNALCFGDSDAWFDGDDHRTMTFVEYKEMVDRLACGLQRSHIKKGDRIGVLGKNSREYFLLYGAAAALGAIVLPINWRLSADEIHFNLNDCAPEALFVDAEFQALTRGLKDRLPTIKKYYNLQPKTGDFIAFDSLMNNPGDFETMDVSGDDGLVLIHTAAVESQGCLAEPWQSHVRRSPFEPLLSSDLRRRSFKSSAHVPCGRSFYGPKKLSSRCSEREHE